MRAWDTEVHRIRYELTRVDGKWLIIEEKLPGELLFRLGKAQMSPPRGSPFAAEREVRI